MSEFPPWTLKGVSTEQRNAAIKAAAASKTPIGAWVGRVVHEAAQAQLAPSRKRVVDPQADLGQSLQTSVATAADMLFRLAEAAEKFAALKQDDRALRGLRRDALLAVRRELE